MRTSSRTQDTGRASPPSASAGAATAHQSGRTCGTFRGRGEGGPPGQEPTQKAAAGAGLYLARQAGPTLLQVELLLNPREKSLSPARPRPHPRMGRAVNKRLSGGTAVRSWASGPASSCEIF